jgi:hypothetical protein
LISTKVHDKKRRQFFLIVGSGLFLIAGVKHFRGHEPAAVRLLVASVCLFVLEFLLPKAAAAVFKVWMTFAHLLGAINTRILLTLVFFVVITPLNWCLKFFGHANHLSTEAYKKQGSAWTPLPPVAPGQTSYENSY